MADQEKLPREVKDAMKRYLKLVSAFKAQAENTGLDNYVVEDMTRDLSRGLINELVPDAARYVRGATA